MNKIRWGIAGPGIIAHKFAEAVKNVDNADIIAVASRSGDKAKSFAEEFGILYSFSTYEEMAASELVDAVYVSTAHPFHISTAEVFLKAGKHVLCEKPLCVNERQAERLRSCAKNNNVFLMEAMWTRFLPSVTSLKKMIAEGIIGEVKDLSADFCYSIEYEEDPKVFENSLAGGSLLDVGTYALHFADAVFGESPENIIASADIKNGIDVHTRMLLKYKNGAAASLSSAIKLEKPSDAYVYGTDGYIYVPNFYKADKFFVFKKDESEYEFSMPYGDNGFEFEIEEVCRCINEGRVESELMPLSKSIEIAKQMDRIRDLIGVKYPADEE